MKVNKLITIFLIIRIIMDIFIGTPVFNFEILGISFLESVNIVFLIFLLYLVIKKNKINKKTIIGFGIFIIYTIIHSVYVTYLNNQAFVIKPFLLESYYIVRSYGMPLLLLYIMMKSKYTFKEAKQLLLILLSIISISIVAFNILEIGETAYSANFNGTDKLLNYSIFSWPTFIKGKYELLTSKGLFYSGNGMSAILFMSLPFVFYCHFKNQKNKKILLLLIFQLIAMLMLGTKVGTYGALLVTFGFIVYLILNYFFAKEKYNNKILFGIIVFAFIFLFIISPGFKKNLYDMNKCVYPICENAEKKNDFKYSLEDIKKMEKDDLIFAINSKKTKVKVPSVYYKMIPLEENIEFWRSIFASGNQSYRFIKENVYKYNLEKLNLNNINLLGIGYNSEFQYLEADYKSEYYYFGILGLIVLLLPLVSTYIYTLIKYIKLFFSNPKKYIDKSYIMFASLLGLVVGLVSGHVFYNLTTFYFLILVVYTSYISIKD